MIEGERVYLAPLDKSNIPLVISWLRDPEVNRYMLSGHEPIAYEDEVAWYDMVASSETDHVFQVHVAKDGRYVGNVGLHRIDATHRSGEAGIMIGSRPDQGRGYGRDALRCLLRFAFDELRLHRVFLRCDPDNRRGVAAYEAVGFTQVGHEREAAFIEGEFRDHLIFDMLEDEYRSRV